MYNCSQGEAFQQLYDGELSGVVYCNDLQVKYFNLLNTPNRLLQMTKDRLLLMSVVIYFNNVSILQPIFDDEVMTLTDSGLISYWTGEFIDERSHSRSYIRRVPKKLKIENLLAIFEICIGLLVFCILVFVLEKLGTRFALIKNIIENITY